MSCEQERFSQLMQRVKQGDSQAFESILTEYGSAIRREVHFTLLDTQLRRFVGDSDVYQSVIMRFFDGLQVGQYTIETPHDLVKLLKGIARNRIAELVRFWRAQRRDLGRDSQFHHPDDEMVTGHGVHPIEAIIRAEAIEAVENILSSTDRQILQWRHDDFSWNEIAAELGKTNGESIRKQHERALAKIASALATVEEFLVT